MKSKQELMMKAEGEYDEAQQKADKLFEEALRKAQLLQNFNTPMYY